MSPGDGRENRLKRYLKEVERNFDIVIIDTPPTPSIWMTSALLASTHYLIPVKPDRISLVGIDLLENIIRDKKDNFDLDLECVGVVLTMVDSTTIVYRQAVEFLSKGRWKKYKYSKELPARTAIARTQMSKTFVLDLPDATAKAALTGIVEELMDRLEN
jgi:chromosome partitioning protein